MKNSVLLFLVFMAILTVQPAHAYLDPGTGSMIIQILAACFATIAIFFKSIWMSIQKFFAKKPKADIAETETTPEETETENK